MPGIARLITGVRAMPGVDGADTARACMLVAGVFGSLMPDETPLGGGFSPGIITRVGGTLAAPFIGVPVISPWFNPLDSILSLAMSTPFATLRGMAAADARRFQS
jgi:hypothetical protein